MWGLLKSHFGNCCQPVDLLFKLLLGCSFPPLCQAVPNKKLFRLLGQSFLPPCQKDRLLNDFFCVFKTGQFLSKCFPKTLSLRNALLCLGLYQVRWWHESPWLTFRLDVRLSMAPMCVHTESTESVIPGVICDLSMTARESFQKMKIFPFSKEANCEMDSKSPQFSGDPPFPTWQHIQQWFRNNSFESDELMFFCPWTEKNLSLQELVLRICLVWLWGEDCPNREGDLVGTTVSRMVGSQRIFDPRWSQIRKDSKRRSGSALARVFSELWAHVLDQCLCQSVWQKVWLKLSEGTEKMHPSSHNFSVKNQPKLAA